MKRLFLIILILAGCASAQTHTEPTLEDNEAVTGNKPFTVTNVHSGTSTTGLANGVYNASACSGSPAPTWCSGSDIGAWVNAAAAQCSSRSQCVIEIAPSSPLTISTPIVFVANQTLRCPASNVIDNSTGHDTVAQLYYNGSGTAVTMNASASRFEGCDLLLGSSVAVGIQLGNYSSYIRDAGIRGGGTSTQLVHVGSSRVPTEDAHIERARFSDFIGYGIACDHANDNFFTDDTFYGKQSNTTGITILIDSACTGSQLSNLVGGSSGKNFLKVQHTLDGKYPTFLFARNTQCDLANSDCYLFDSSLRTANLDYVFLNCWAAGAGGTGIHVSGGSGMRFEGCIVRENSKDGFTLDQTNSNGIFIDHNLIEGNNQSKGSYNGITVSAHVNALSVTGNIIQDYPETGGNQGYAFSTSSDIEGLIFANNFCSNNVMGCANVSAVRPTKLTYYGNIAISLGVSSQPQYFLGWARALNFQANQGSACASGDFALGTGWGRGASVGSTSGYSQTCVFTITSGSGSFSSAPTFTFTFPNAFSNTLVCTADVQAVTGSGGAIIFNNTTPSATAPVFTATTSAGAAFTPAASETYKVVVRCGP